MVLMLKAAKDSRDKEKALKPSLPKASVGTKQEEEATTSRLRKSSRHLDIKVWRKEHLTQFSEGKL